MGDVKTYTWDVIELGCFQKNETYPDLVVNAKWLYTISDDLGNQTSIEGYTTFNTEQMDSFIPFDQLTKETVIQWIESKENVEKHKERLANQLKEKLDPPVINKTLVS